MERVDNYKIQAQKAKARFLTYDQDAIIAKFRLKHDKRYLYPVLLGITYRLDRTNGDLEKNLAGTWHDANTFSEVMTLLDLLCDAKPERYLTGRWLSTQNFGLMFHQNLLEDKHDPAAEFFDKDPALLRRRCIALGGTPIPGADIGYAIELFDGLRIGVQFWQGDEEFRPRLRYLWDENALQYLRYETMYYAIDLLVGLLLSDDVL